MSSDDALGATEYAMGPVPIKAEIPVPGDASNVAKHAQAAKIPRCRTLVPPV